MSFIELDNLRMVYPDGTEAVKGSTIAIEEGEFVVLLGPSGCGKTTTLRMIAGLEVPTAGTVKMAGRDVTRLSPSRRDVGFVFQFYALYPHLSVRENIAFPLRAAGESDAAVREAVDRVSQRLGLGEQLSRFPPQLSGGDQQRVSLARAMVRRPAVYLMDEPLGTLDSDQRLAMREFIREQQQELKVATIYVTHDQEEAMSLADRIVVMDRGDICQVGTPTQIYDDPANRFVAEFVGSPGMNFMAGPEVVGIRPEHIIPADAGQVEGTVAMNEYMGSHRFVHLDTSAGRLVFRAATGFHAEPGAKLKVELEEEHVCRFNPENGDRIR